MTEILTALLTYGPLGIFCAVLWLAYTNKDKQVEELNKEKDKQVEELNKKIQDLLESHSKALDEVRKAHADREREVATLLKDYGNSVVTAVEQAHEMTERLWSIRK